MEGGTANTMSQYNGHYSYDHKTVSEWQSSAIGVYYCGHPDPASPNTLLTFYVGKGTGEGGIRARLLDHINNERWLEVTHFGYALFNTAREAELFEAAEIKRMQPPYNKQGL